MSRREILGNRKPFKPRMARDDPEIQKILAWKAPEIPSGGEPAERPEPEVATPATNIQIPEKYIILPGAAHGSYSYPDLLVAIEKTYYSKNWEQAHEALHQEGSFMLTIRQYFDFIKTLKSKIVYNGNGIKLDKGTIDKVLDEILTKRKPWRAEWLDAKFSKQGERMFITYHRFENGKLKEETEPLEECCLMENCWFDIGSASRQGMPTKKSRKQEVYYWYPVDGTVARFGAVSVRANFDCDGYPQYASPALGVRAVRRHA